MKGNCFIFKPMCFPCNVLSFFCGRHSTLSYKHPYIFLKLQICKDALEVCKKSR